MRFSNKVIAVTGGGSGVSEVTVKKLAGDGAHVVVADIDEAGGTRVSSEVASAEPFELGNAISWLLSDEASFVSGETMLVDAAQAQK